MAIVDDGKYPAALEAYLTQWQEIAERVRRQMEPFRDIQEPIRKSVQPFIETREKLQEALEPILASQERWRQVIESVRMQQIVLPDLSPIAKQVIDFQKVIQESIGPAFLELHKEFKELPARTQEALLLLGEHGWYLDPEISLPALWKLKKAFADGNVLETEEVLVKYFEERLAEIEKSISTKFPHRIHLVHSAFEAHRRGEYALSIPVLLAQSDGICKEMVGQYLFIRQGRKPSTAIYVDQLVAHTYMAALLSPLATILPIGATERERPAGFTALNRHMVLHGESLDYGSKINSLKTISLVNYVAHVLPTVGGA